MKNFGKYTAQAILEKSFNSEFKGYSMLEVDGFLDEVIQDYQEFETQIQKAVDHIQELQRSNANLQAKLIELEGRLDHQSSGDNPQQSDLLKRLAKLEQEVYQAK